MRKKIESTYEEAIKDKKRKANIDREYKKLLISEMLITLMKQNQLLVRKLAKAAK